LSDTNESTKRTTARGKSFEGFTAEERAAMKDRAKELKAGSRGRSQPAKADGDGEVRAKLAEMQEPDRVLGERLHGLITAGAPELEPRLWYGMPAYAKAGKIVCHFQPAEKFKTRYATLAFSDNAKLDEGAMWPVAYALPALTAADEQRITALVQKAVS
jgi:hypothetical protein